jgi:folate-binding protein YgfZ
VSGLDAAERACAIANRSELGRLVATGPDLLGLLHRLSTGDVKGLQPGEGRPTVLTSAKGRIVERLSVHHQGDDGVLLVAGPGAASRVLTHLAKFTFAENTGLADVTASTFAFALLGPRWKDGGRSAGIPELAPYATAPCVIAGTRVQAARTNGFDGEGALVTGPRGSLDKVYAALASAAASVGGAPADTEAVEAWRILSGLPAPGHELTEEYNPLEAGLYAAISFTKGCYVGQEVVARLNTYGKVSRALVRLAFPEGAPVPVVGAPVHRDGVAIGVVTSAVLPPGREAPAGLAFVKARAIAGAAPSVTVDVGGAPCVATRARG